MLMQVMSGHVDHILPVFVVKDILVGTGNVTELSTLLLLLPLCTILFSTPLFPGVRLELDLAPHPVPDHVPLDSTTV